MEITYIGHSGFLIEWEACYWLFDYYKGDIPVLNPDKKLVVFVSHKHLDHFNPVIFRLADQYHDIEYVLSSDIRLPEEKRRSMRLTREVMDKIISVKPSSHYELYDKSNQSIILQTLKSTDCGVAFLLQYQGKTIYHAGDLNEWVFKDRPKQYNNNMTALFRRRMNELKDIPIDIAFAPLDPRQEEYYSKGLESLINSAKVRYVFPMHFWNKTTVITQFKKERAQYLKGTVIMDISHSGQKWKIDI